MKSKKLDEMSVAELLEKEKGLKRAIYLGIAVMAVAVIIYGYMATEKGIGPLTFLPLILLLLILLFFKGIKEVRKELASRNP